MKKKIKVRCHDLGLRYFTGPCDKIQNKLTSLMNEFPEFESFEIHIEEMFSGGKKYVLSGIKFEEESS